MKFPLFAVRFAEKVVVIVYCINHSAI